MKFVSMPEEAREALALFRELVGVVKDIAGVVTRIEAEEKDSEVVRKVTAIYDEWYEEKQGVVTGSVDFIAMARIGELLYGQA